MKTIAFSLFLLVLAPLQARAFETQNIYSQGDLLSYVAMPLAVSSVTEVPGVQTDRVGELVTYMDQANVPPADFVDVFRYVPVALVLRTDRRPDFVQWVGDQVNRGVVGTALVTAMERQLGTYTNSIPVATRYRTRYRQTSDYAYRDVFADDYVPVVVRRYTDRVLLDPLALVEMPVAVANVYDLGLPVQRVSSLAVGLNLGDVPPVQFVELFRYAPAALVVSNGYAPDFVQYVNTEVSSGVVGIPLVQAVYQQLPTYGVTPQLDLASPYYYGTQTYYAPAAAQYYVDPVSPVYVPPVVQTRVGSAYAAGATAPPQVQRLLNAQNGGAVVTNPRQARRELARGGAKTFQLPPTAASPSASAFGRATAARAIAQRGLGHGHARHRIATHPGAPPAPMTATRAHGNGGNGHGRHAAAAPPRMIAAPQAIPHGNGNGHGNGHDNGRGHGGPPAAVAPAPAPAPAAAAGNHGNGNPPGQQKKGKGH